MATNVDIVATLIEKGGLTAEQAKKVLKLLFDPAEGLLPRELNIFGQVEIEGLGILTKKVRTSIPSVPGGRFFDPLPRDARGTDGPNVLQRDPDSSLEDLIGDLPSGKPGKNLI